MWWSIRMRPALSANNNPTLARGFTGPYNPPITNPSEQHIMFCINTQTFPDGYTIIRVTDAEGVVCSFCGFDKWPAHRLLHEMGIAV